MFSNYSTRVNDLTTARKPECASVYSNESIATEAHQKINKLDTVGGLRITHRNITLPKHIDQLRIYPRIYPRAIDQLRIYPPSHLFRALALGEGTNSARLFSTLGKSH